MSERYVQVEGEPYAQWWCEQYGMAAGVLDGCTFWRRGRWNIWIATADVDPHGLRPVDGVGIPFLRTGREVWKPTQIAAIEFGLEATRNVVELDPTELRAFLDRQTLRFDGEDPRARASARGFVIARFGGVPVGCGLWVRGTLESAVSKGRRLDDLDLPDAGGGGD